MSSFVLFIEYYWGDQVKKDEKSVACSTHGTDKKCIQNFNRKISESLHLEVYG
jgi:hypothetical protein